MYIENMVLAKARPLQIKLATKSSRHCNILVRAAQEKYRLSINALSLDKTLIEYVQTPLRTQPYLDTLSQLEEGIYDYNAPSPFSSNSSIREEFALDYQNGLLFPIDISFSPIPINSDHGDDLNTHFSQLFHSTYDNHGYIYSFGKQWGPLEIADSIFHFPHGKGLHDIHANQGSILSLTHAQYNERMQDGGLLFQIPQKEGESHTGDQWFGLFLKFTTQHFPTNEQGAPLSSL